jgi:hypothetical protein
MPRERLCVGCLRCTTQHPDISTILPNPARNRLGDAYITPYQIDMIMYEAEKGNLYVKGAGFKGKFGGKGWDSIWTDMSEIVRPTRDGIYGREVISTEVTVGERLPSLLFDNSLNIMGPVPQTISLPFPILFETLPNSVYDAPKLAPILAEAARELHSFALLPYALLQKYSLRRSNAIPLLEPHEWDSFQNFGFPPKLLELAEWNESVFHAIKARFPETFIILRCDFEDDLLSRYQSGVRLFHLTADPHGRSRKGKFIIELIRNAHLTFVKERCRDSVTLIGSGGMVAAEHIPKAILLGLDVVALNTPLLVALQGELSGKKAFHLPNNIRLAWGVQRIKNLMAAWQDQLFEFVGAMGLREIRRMRGEIGRTLFQKELEREAFTGITGYE